MAGSPYKDRLYQANRRRLLDGGPLCHWCRERPAICADHVVAIAEGGTSELDNVVASCRWCNARRGAQLGNARLRAAQARRFELAVAREAAWWLALPAALRCLPTTNRGRRAIGTASG